MECCRWSNVDVITVLKEPGAGAVRSPAGVCGCGPGGGNAFNGRHPAGSHQASHPVPRR